MIKSVELIIRRRFAKVIAIIFLSIVAAGVTPLFLAQAAQNSPDQPEVVWTTANGDDCGYKLDNQRVIFPVPGPFLQVDFSISRKNGQPFPPVQEQDITATHDNRSLKVSTGALQRQAGKSADAYVLVDVSKSMRDRDEFGFDKLQAVKSSLGGFVDQLGAKDRVAIAKFDDSLSEQISATDDKVRLHRAIDELTGRNGSRLYKAIKSSIDAARDSNVHNLIVISDGVDSTPKAVQYRRNENHDQLQQFERENEDDIIAQALRYGIFIYAVEMGNDQQYLNGDYSKPSPIYVYRNSLQRIAKETGGGNDEYIDLLTVARNDLSNRLNTVLERIKRNFTYDYSLKIPLAGIAGQDEIIHKVAVNVRIENCQQSLIIGYIWKQGAPAPVIPDAVVVEYKKRLIEPFVGTKDLDRLSLMYLSMMLALALLSRAPPLARWMSESREARVLRKSIVHVGKNSQHIDGQCPGEKNARPFKEGDNLLVCPDCEQVHHLDCWQLSGGKCYIHDCPTSKKPKPLTTEIVRRYNLVP